MYLNSQTKAQINLLLSIKFWILTLALVLIYATLIFAQNVVYIDPTNQGDPGEDGSIEHPFDSWSDVTFQDSTTYSQKRGTSIIINSAILVDDRYYVTINAYGEGERPYIQSTASNVISISRSSHCIIENLRIEGDLMNSTSVVGIGGHWNTSSANSNNNTVRNCELLNAYNGIRVLPYSTDADTVTIINCNIHNIREDGIFIKYCDKVTIKDCHIWDINLNWHILCHTQSCAPGDCIQLVGECNDYLVENNILDRRETGNKFAFAYTNSSFYPVSGRLIGNTLYPPKDTTDDQGGKAIYVSNSDYIEIAYNKIIGKNYQAGTGPMGIGHIEATHVDFYYNLIDSVSGLNFTTDGNVISQRIYNNTFVNGYGTIIYQYDSTYLYNNIFALQSGATAVHSAGVLVSDSNKIVIGNSNNWGTDPGFVDWQNQNFKLNENSPCKNMGSDYNGYYYDIDSVYVPQENIRDIGSYEYYAGGQSNNNPPVINNQSFNVNENTSNGQVVGTVIATDPDAGQTLTFTITGGNTSGAFQIGSTSGVITVANSSVLDYETNPVFNLTIQVQDNGQGNLTDQATVTVNLTDVNEVPNIEDQSFAIDENTPNGQQVATVAATDPDNGQTLTYTITAGNTSGAFQIGSTSGVLSVSNSSALDYETNPVFSLTVEVQDNGLGNLTDQATVTVNITDVNEVPNIEDQSFAIDENTPNGQQVGTVAATDPDNGQTLTYTITAGNTSGAFQIGSTSGVLSVSNSSVLDYETNPVFSLTVEVQDNGLGNLTDQATITVNLTDVNEIPNIEDQSFAIDENTPNGQQVGTVVATDPDNGQTLTYTITAGNTSGAFQIGSTSGVLSVSNSSALDYETNPVFSLTVEVQDNGLGNLTDQATVTVNITDVNEVPNIEDQSFAIDENTPNGQQVGTVAATDPDNGQTLTYTITAGNTSGAFQIGSTSGVLSVSNSSVLDYETNPVFSLTVEVQDNGLGNLTDQATITVNLTDVNEIPNIEDQSFAIDENTPNGQQVGTVVATDPDNGQTLTFTITAGNTSGAFQIGSTSGVITVANSSVLDYETNPVFNLTVQVEDNGQGNLTDQATVTVNLTDVNEPPAISEQSFNVDVNSELIRFELNNNSIDIGTVQASDPDIGQSVTFSIIQGNEKNIFGLNVNTGELEISDPYQLNFIELNNYPLIIKVVDNSPEQLSANATINVIVNIYTENTGEFDSGTGGDDLMTSVYDMENNYFTYNIYPNPANSYVNIGLDNLQGNKLIITIINVSGEIILRKSYKDFDTGLIDRFDVGELGKGLYLVNITNGDVSKLDKFIKL